MKTNKILFLIMSLAVLPLLGMSDLEDGILNSDVEKVKNALDSASLTEYNKIGLIDLANDIIFKRLKDIEYLRFGDLSNIKEYQEATVKPIWMMALGSIGLFLPAVIMQDLKRPAEITVTLGVMMVSAVVSIGGIVLFSNRKRAFKEKINQAYTDAVKIKKLIHDKVCIS